ncbi:MAG: hypothetical protein E6Q69_03580 [Aquipseudomonas alcaligenes]|jgi:hypothetical protein|uniref:Uncharacterized protein n=1 Tax=Aquipseudomonas alcaligenes TaxID=43263 RepID=A0A5C7WBU0_AQUAC|nr:MAG: hypothetical protein E6Q69_03580 [Pseudomonas alcaligenes]
MSTDNDTEFSLTTEEFANLNRVKAASVRRQIQRTGSYFGVIPLRHANGRMLFAPVQPKADQQSRGVEK